MKFLLKSHFLILLLTLFVNCKEDSPNIEFENQHYFYSNTEGNNTIEGSHIYIKKKAGDTLFFEKSNKGLPKAVLAKTVKGKGIKFMENNNDWHHNRLSQKLFEDAVKDLGL